MLTANQTPVKPDQPLTTIELQHPLLHVPAVADVLRAWQENGRVIGHELLFPDGHHCHLTKAEIEALQVTGA